MFYYSSLFYRKIFILQPQDAIIHIYTDILRERMVWLIVMFGEKTTGLNILSLISFVLV